MAIVNDVVLIYIEETPLSFARIESILPDAKKDWYQIKLLLLNIPLQVVTWILKDEYIMGEEFQMNGKKMKLEKVECPGEDISLSGPAGPPPENKSQKTQKKTVSKKTKQGKIISFSDIKKNHEPDV